MTYDKEQIESVIKILEPFKWTIDPSNWSKFPIQEAIEILKSLKEKETENALY